MEQTAEGRGWGQVLFCSPRSKPGEENTNGKTKCSEVLQMNTRTRYKVSRGRTTH